MYDLMTGKGLYFAPDDAAGGGGGGGGDGKKKDDPLKGKDGDKGTEALEWDTWHNTLPKNAQTLVADHVKGLKTALGSERDARKTAEKDLRDVAKKLEEGSVAQKEVLKLADDVAVGNTKADFYEDAHTAGVSNLKLAYHVAVTEELFDKRGNVNFEKMKEQYPELFGKSPRRPPGGAGDGAGGDLGQKPDMNAFIRTSAGRQK